MKRLRKIYKWSIIILLPLLLGATVRSCIFFDFVTLLHCYNTINFTYNDEIYYGWDNWPYSYGRVHIFALNGGKILKGLQPNEGNGCYSSFFYEFVSPETDKNIYAIERVFTPPGFDYNVLAVGESGTILGADIRHYAEEEADSFFVISCPTTNNLNSIEQSDDYDVIIAVGDGGTVLRSTDGGLTWELVNFSSTINIKDVYIDSYLSDFIQVVGEDLSLYLTFNGGVTWQHIPLAGPGLDSKSGTFPTINRIYHYDGLNAFLVGDAGTLIRTTDNFNTFSFVDLQTTENINDVFFISPDSGFVIGDNGTARFTSDAGESWIDDPDVTTFLNGTTLNRIKKQDDDFAVIVGDSGLSIMFARDSSAFLTGVKDGQSVVTEYSLSQNYPNPFNPTTKINYSVPQFRFVTIKVYDLLGKEIATLVNEEKNAGNYQIDFEGSGLPSGVYFYKLTSGNFTETKKLVLMK